MKDLRIPRRGRFWAMTLLLTTILLCSHISLLSGLEIFVVNSSSRTLTRIDTVSGDTDNSFAQLGLTPNLMDYDEQYFYVVCSGDNAVQVLNRQNGEHIRYLPVAASCNPWDVLKVGDYLYVSGLFTDKVYKINPLGGAVVGSLSVGAAPEGLASDGERLYVCNTGGYANNYAGSSVSVVDLASFSVTATVPVWTNPQYAVARNGYLHVSCTGNWTDVAGKVDIIDLDSLERVQRLDIGGNPGSLWINSEGTAYVGEGMGIRLYSYGADSYTIYHDAADPLPYHGYSVDGTDTDIVLMEPNWSGNSIIRHYDSSFNLLGTYDAGMTSTDMVAIGSVVSSDDEIAVVHSLRLYPNPAPRGATIRFAKLPEGSSILHLYNLRGQLCANQILESDTAIRTEGLPSGIYLYRLENRGHSYGGKILISE